MDKRELANAMVKKNLADALFALLKEKSISEVSVSELIERAHVARASFYRNFNSLEEILQHELDKLTARYIEESPHELVDYANFDYLTWKFGFYKTYADKLLALKGAGLGDLILATTNKLSLYGFTKNYTFYDQIERYFVAGAFNNVTLHWLEAGAQETPEEMAKLFRKLYTNGTASTEMNQ